MKNNKSNMTINELAVLMKAGFKGVNKKIDNVTDLVDKLAASTLNHFERIEEKMATKTDLKDLEVRLDTKIDDVELRLSSRIESINNRLDHSAENKVGYDKFKPLAKRVEALEKA